MDAQKTEAASPAIPDDTPVKVAPPTPPAAAAPAAPEQQLDVWQQEQLRLKDKQWIQTFSGGQFWPLAPDPKNVKVADIAHALANKCRFTGHSTPFYSVAQHSILVSYLVPQSHALAALLHDAGEAYLPDIAAPIKSFIWVRTGEKSFVAISQLEEVILATVFQGIGYPELIVIANSETVKKADIRALATECRDVMGPPPAPWNLNQEPAADFINPMTPFEAEGRFLARFQELTATGSAA